MSDIPFLREQLRKGYSDDPWHGPATEDLLQGVTASQAAAHPVPGAHSLWEIVLRAMVHGLLQHNAYHSGQIALLLRALQDGGR